MKSGISKGESRKQSLNSRGGEQHSGRPTFQLVDKRPEAVAQRKLQAMANNSVHVNQASPLQAMANAYSTQKQHQAYLGNLSYATPPQKIMDATVVQGVFLKNNLDPMHWKDMEDGKNYYQIGGIVNNQIELQGDDGIKFFAVITNFEIGIANRLDEENESDGLMNDGEPNSYNMLDDMESEKHKLIKLQDLPEEPKQYIRINSFAFAKSNKLPIASHSYATCMGVILHDHEQKLGGMAHIDTDDLEELSDKTNLIVNSVKAMITSLKPNKMEALEVNLFGGSGLMGKDNFQGFLDDFTAQLIDVGFDKSQIHSLLNTKNSAKLAVYFPLQGNFYLGSEHGKTKTLEERSIKRLEYNSDDFEDQEDVKDEIRGGEKIIVEIEFDEEGQEVAHIKYALNSNSITSSREGVD